MRIDKKLLSLLLLAGLANGAFALDLNNPLPNWIDPGREKSDGKPPVIAQTKAAPPAGFRIPAEYEPIGAVVLSWAAYTPMLTGIARAVAGPGGAQVWMVAGPASLPGVPAASYTRINAPLDTVWVRDYGPFGLTASGKPGIVDTIYRHYQYRRNDDAVPQAVGKAKGIEVFGMPLVLDGGNLLVDSKGTLFTTRRTYMWNSDKSQEQVDAMLKSYYGVKKIVVFDYAGYPGEPADGTAHIDMFLKLLDDNTILVSLSDDEPFKTNAEKALAWFRANKAPNGQPYRIITVKGWYTDAWYTYTNSLVVNGTAIIPSYSGRPQDEAAAKAAYESAGYKVAPVLSDESIRYGGSVHCTTQSIPKAAGLKAEEFFTAAPEFTGTTVTAPPVPLKSKGDGSALDQLIGK